MQTITLQNGKKITLFDSIKSLSISRFNLLNKYSIQEAGLGSDLASIERKFSHLDAFLAASDLQSAIQERINMHYNFYLGLSKINFKSRCFLCLIKDIDGLAVADLEDDDHVDAVLQKMDAIGLTQGDVEDQLTDLKKKLIKN